MLSSEHQRSLMYSTLLTFGAWHGVGITLIILEQSRNTQLYRGKISSEHGGWARGALLVRRVDILHCGYFIYKKPWVPVVLLCHFTLQHRRFLANCLLVVEDVQVFLLFSLFPLRHGWEVVHC